MLDVPLEQGQKKQYTVTLEGGDEYVFDRGSDETHKWTDSDGKVYLVDYDYETGERVLYAPVTELTRRPSLKGIAKVLATLEDHE